MANKVLSIKMDEKDIERLRKYHEALVAGGFVSPNTLTLNGLYKHLLLDYLEEDVNQVFATYSNWGMAPKCINPEKLNEENGISLSNTYSLSEAAFKDYKQCVKETLEQELNELRENAELFNEVFDSSVVIEEGTFYQMRYVPWHEKEEGKSFWDKKAFQMMEIVERESVENSINADIEMIKESSLPEELKQTVIDEIEEYEKSWKQNYKITHGGRIWE